MIRTKNLYFDMCQKSDKLYGMTDEERDKLQSRLRKMYLDIEQVCERHGLTVMVAYGSVLGAIRHQGFIPWDDDMDLFMLREDYDKFVNVYSKELPENYIVSSPNGGYEPIERFAKVIDINTKFVEPKDDPSDVRSGIFVDIFPLENTPTNKLNIAFRKYYTYFLMYVSTSVRQYKTKNCCMKDVMYGCKEAKRNYQFRNIIGFLFSWRSYAGWLRRIDKFTQYKKDTGYLARPVGPANSKSFVPIPKDVYIPAVKSKFDDIEVFIPHDSVKFCELQYGNWQQVPPLNERWRHFIQTLNF